MLAARTVLPAQRTDRPPVVLVHGAANSAAVWTYWQAMLADAGYASHAVDLRGHGASAPVDLSRTSMQEYADDVRSLVRQVASPPALVGWSMGGLVAMLAAVGGSVRAVVGLAPSTPTSTTDESLPLRFGEFDAAEYGITSRDPDQPQPAMPDLDREERALAVASLCRESRYARDERARGVVIGSLPCPLLIATGTADAQWPRSRYNDLHLPAEHLTVEGASHWGIVLNRRSLTTLVPQALAWLGTTETEN
jgi:pimeloyl-ACP methyl ester carboxylesterase